MKGSVTQGYPLESQTTRPQTTKLPLVDGMFTYNDPIKNQPFMWKKVRRISVFHHKQLPNFQGRSAREEVLEARPPGYQAFDKGLCPTTIPCWGGGWHFRWLPLDSHGRDGWEVQVIIVGKIIDDFSLQEQLASMQRLLDAKDIYFCVDVA